ncbi:response regulator [Novosphingobium olei]|uniref:histidine kinase n=1 Tax=Novosphingobium olei TaxID=2728851 RepID=A0A7Y0BL01_9SPHN|nr:response regulator [Novosphingobium olei]NML92265.1 response regulator [Novosphingobium olei]BEV01895.1 response regulator [Novosphingobium olei]
MRLPDPVRVLAVDDVEENLRALEALLAQDGIEVVKARSGFEALELLLKEDFALALLDVMMPGMDGFELAELMRGIERTRAVPIIFLTALATDERKRFRGFEAGAVDYLLKPVDPVVLSGKVAVFAELARQRRELARQRDEMGLVLARLRAHSDNSPLAIIEIDSDLRIITWTRSTERMTGFSRADVLGLSLMQVPWLPEEARRGFIEAMQALLDRGEASETLHHRLLRADGAAIDGEWYCSSLSEADGRGTLALQVLDVTERRRAEETQALLVGELNHRVKNSLATVQAIATQSVRHAASPQDFLSTFTGRLQALARAHSLLSAATWEGASVGRLVEEQLALGAVAPERLVASGPEAQLAPEPALRLALVFHELVTNAIKYGALSNGTGRVDVTWETQDGNLLLNWRESGGPPVRSPERSGFGTRLIESSLGGKAVAQFHAEGLEWALCMPLAQGASCAMPPRTVTRAEPAGDRLPLAGCRVLIVEDEPLVAMELEMLLEDAGATPLGPATTCAEAISAAARLQPHFALLDGNLHGEKVDKVASTFDAAGIGFAFVSGYGREHLPEDFRDRPVIGKPFDPAQLLAVAGRLAASIVV